jgi:hypothetical protein
LVRCQFLASRHLRLVTLNRSGPSALSFADRSEINGTGVVKGGMLFEEDLSMRIVGFIVLFFCATTCLGKVNKVKKVEVKPVAKRLVAPVDVTQKITSKDVEKIIPTDVALTSTSGNILTRIADRGFNMWFNSEAVQSSVFGRFAQRTQEKLKTDVVIQEAKGEDKVSHKFSFRLEAFQALAKIEYTGWLKADVNYDAKEAATNVQVKEKVFDDKNLVLMHKGSSKEALSMVGLDWSF